MDIDVKDPKVIRWVVAALVILVLVPVYFFTTVLPVTYPARKVEIGKLEARHQELSRDLEKARLLVKNLDRVEKEYEILHEQWEVAQMLLPQTNEMPALLRKVTAAGQQSGVEFQLFKPQPAVPREFYSENPIDVKVQGGFHQTGIFLSRLANLNRIVNVANLKLKGLDKQDDQPFTVEAAMTLVAYTQQAGGAPATAEPTQDKLTATGAAGAAAGGR
jgi:type IV pilus assembly protein PilO